LCSKDERSPHLGRLHGAPVLKMIVVSPPVTLLPEGFEAADLAVLVWLAAEGARLRRGVALVH
jgi:hypothetical protein